MGYKDPEKQREYQRQWYARRRDEFFRDKECIDCGSTEDLTLDHLDPTMKVDHRIWSWNQKRRDAEIAKCVVRCEFHHYQRHGLERQSHGIARYQAGCRCKICKLAKSEAGKRETRRQK